MVPSRKLAIFVIILLGGFFVCDIAISEEMRNPFKDWLPIKISRLPEVVVEDEPVIYFEEEVYFDPSVYTVEGLIWGAEKPKAIINNVIYNIGDSLDIAKIIGINKDGVTLAYDDAEYVITTKQVINVASPDNKAE